MKTENLLRATAALIFLTAAIPGLAGPVAIDTTSSSNGITDLYSATFDPPLEACTGADPAWCTFFAGGTPGPTREIVVTPTPTRVTNAVPLGITPVPASGSFLDLALNPGNTELTLAGGTIAFPPLTLTIQGTSATPTLVNASGAGIVFKISPQTVAINAAGQAEFLVAPVPIGTAVDFSTFSTIVDPPNGSCAGPQCALIPILTLDAVRFRLFIDYDPTFTTFTASYIGQTQNNSILYITMNSGTPEIVVTDSVAPATDLEVPFGNVTELTSATQTVTVTNSGQANLLLGAVGSANSLAPPFALANDTCSGATVLPAANCTFNVTFSPGSVGTFADSLDIPSNDADEPSITVAVSGNGVAELVPNISVTDSVAPTTDGLVPFGSASTGAQLDQTVTVTNTGNADLVLGSVGVPTTLAAPFSLVNDNCSGQTVAPTASCTIGIRFEPTVAGTFSGAFDIPSNDAADPTVVVSVSGTGTSLAIPDISVTDDTVPGNDLLVPFGNITEGTSRDLTVTITNVGGAALVLGTIAGTNPLAEPFSLVTNNCSGQTLAPTASCIFVTRYAPTATGAASDSLDIPSNDPDEPSVTVSVSGTGITLGEGGVGTPSPSGASSGFMAIDPATLLLLSAARGLGLETPSDSMIGAGTFDPPRVFTGGIEDWFVLGVLLFASVLAQVFLIQRSKHPDNVHSPPLAWLRAALYFSVVLVLSWATGVLQVLVHVPCVLPGQLGNPVWLGLTALWAGATIWGYVYWWPRGTLTYDRKLYLVPQVLFGLAWGLTSGQLTLVLWALVEDFGFARWITALLVFFLLSGYGQIYQSGWWDIHVSPPHNRRATNAKKVLFAHMPFLAIALTHFTLFGNALVFVGFHAIALACSAVAMRFPPFWEKDGPVVNRDTAIGV